MKKIGLFYATKAERTSWVAEKIQNAVSTAVESMTGFAAKAVNVHVGGVSFQ